jgi:uncharacterized protein YegJ (DUF2314 family)
MNNADKTDNIVLIIDTISDWVYLSFCGVVYGCFI